MFFLPDARAHDQSRRQKTALLQAEIRKTVKRSVVAGSSFYRFFSKRSRRVGETTIWCSSGVMFLSFFFKALKKGGGDYNLLKTWCLLSLVRVFEEYFEVRFLST